MKHTYVTLEPQDEKQLQKIFTDGENARKIPKIIFIVRILVYLQLYAMKKHTTTGGLR